MISLTQNIQIIFVSLLSILLFLVALEAILRKSEQINLLSDANAGADKSKDINSDSIQLKSLVSELERTHGHFNSLHLKNITFESSILNFVDGWRLTTNQPSSPKNNLFIFGGSTIQCIEVSDSNTICSSMQRSLNDESIPILVKNRGVSGMTVRANQVELSKTKLNRGDIVVIYFGANDSKLDTYSQQAIIPFRYIPGYLKILGLLRIKFKLRLAHWVWLETVKPADRTVKNAEANANNVKNALTEIFEQVSNSGAKFFTFLQPNIFTKSAYTKQELEIHNRSKINPRIVKLQYSEYIKALSRFPWFFPLTGALDSQIQSPYLDWCHLQSSGNALVAQAMLKTLKERGVIETNIQ